MKRIHIVRGRYEMNGVNVYFDIEFFDSIEKAEQYRKARERAKYKLGESDIEYYTYSAEIY